MVPPAETRDSRLSRFTGAFRSPALEAEFRAAVWPAWTHQIRVTSAIAAFLILAFSYTDYAVLGASPEFHILLGARIVASAYMAGLVVLSRPSEYFGALDHAVLTGALVFSAAYCLVVILKPGGVMIHAMSFAIIVLSIYLFLPNRLLLTLVSGLTASAGFVAVAATHMNQNATDVVTFALLLLACNVLGGVAVGHLHRLRRQEYANLMAAKGANERLEAQRAELRQMADDFADARDQATHANHAKSEFLAHMSHELRSPLNAIIGFSEIINDELHGPLEQPKYKEYVNDIHASGLHLLEVLNDILDLSKAEAGKLELNEVEVEAPKVIDASFRLVRERANGAQLTLVAEAPDDLPTLRADERMVKQILLNLLTNSLKFTESGGEVTVTARLDRDGNMVLSVADTGIGIAPEDIAKVMEPYGQADEGGAYDYAGTGLGLPLVKAMVELHDGAFDLESEPGIGTTVTIRFPGERVSQQRAA
jgi:signal transduction histidine kinase